MTMLSYGKVITETGYKDGAVVNEKRFIHESITVTSRKDLLDQMFNQLSRLQGCDEIKFTVYADHRTHDPIRIEVISEEKL